MFFLARLNLAPRRPASAAKSPAIVAVDPLWEPDRLTRCDRCHRSEADDILDGRAGTLIPMTMDLISEEVVCAACRP